MYSDSMTTAALNRVRAEYLEMPGTTLRVEQVARLCGLDRTVCKSVLDALVDARFLHLKPHGAYVRLAEATGSCQSARADLDPQPGMALAAAFRADARTRDDVVLVQAWPGRMRDPCAARRIVRVAG